MYDRVR